LVIEQPAGNLPLDFLLRPSRMSGRKIEGDSVAHPFPLLVSQAQPLHTRAGTERASDLRVNGLDPLDRELHRAALREV
jgi:hypothetical protein